MYYSNEGYEIIYTKGDNSTLHRQVKSRPIYSIGDKTSYGWVVKDILYFYQGKAYTQTDYIKLMNKKVKKRDILFKLRTIDLSMILKIVIEIFVVYYFFVNMIKK